MKTRSFPKGLKLRKRSEFLRVSREGRRLSGKILAIDCRRFGEKETRLGITASRHYGDAHERNRFKRLVREAFRNSRSELPLGFELNVFPRKEAKGVSFEALRSEFSSLLSSL